MWQFTSFRSDDRIAKQERWWTLQGHRSKWWTKNIWKRDGIKMDSRFQVQLEQDEGGSTKQRWTETSGLRPILHWVIRHKSSKSTSFRPIELVSITKYAGVVSAVATICASVIQGSALGPDLHLVHEKNRIFKFADDTYLVVAAINTGTCQEEINHLQTWAAENNLKLNQDKTKEIVFTATRKQVPPPPCLTIERKSSES